MLTHRCRSRSAPGVCPVDGSSQLAFNVLELEPIDVLGAGWCYNIANFLSDNICASLAHYTSWPAGTHVPYRANTASCIGGEVVLPT